LPYFICPNCQDRSFAGDGLQGLSHQAVGCARCGFGFVFQLLEDYFPHPDGGFLACDKEARILASGRGVFELTGFREQDLLGRDVRAGLGLRELPEPDPIATAIEWGVRRMDQPAVMRHAAGRDKRIVCDIFPAYDSDGGVLVSIAPQRDSS